MTGLKNLIKRALTGIIFVALLIGGIILHPVTFLILFSIITGLTLWEFYGLTRYYENAGVKRIISTLGGTYLFVATFLFANNYTGGYIYFPFLAFLMYTIISELYFKESNPINNWALTIFPQVYCAGFFSLLNFIASSANADGIIEYHPLFVLAIFIIVWVNDTGAYCIGSLFGKNRLFERISPKKSWEGFIGGMVAALIAAFIFGYFFSDISVYKWLGLAAIIVVFATWGDLAESLLKRTVGVKDSGTALPGHGGFLDRFDSIMMVTPAAYMYIELVIRN